MEDTELLNLWKSFDTKLNESLLVNKKNVEDIMKIKVKSLLGSMTALKIFTVLTGVIWVGFLDVLIVSLWHIASPFFLISAGIQMLLTKLAIGVYIYQLITIHQLDVSDPILISQKKTAELKSTTIWIARILFLQFPAWTTFYLTANTIANAPVIFLVIQCIVTLFFTYLAIWLFFNIKYENRNKNWFRLIFNGKEWEPVMKAMALLEEIEEEN